VITGNAAANALSGSDNTDTLIGGGGNDTLTGGNAADAFGFNVAPGAANADVITDFTPATDMLQFDHATFAQMGAVGDFVAGDARFYAAAGASGGHDANDRLIYNTTTGQLY